MPLSFKHHFSVILIAGTMLAGCIPRDPRYTGNVAFQHNETWETGHCYYYSDPTPRPQINDTLPLRLDELIDLALRNNPSTSESWERARSAAFNWQASESQLYPSITLNEQLSLLKQNFGKGGEDVDTGDELIPGVNGYRPNLSSTLIISYLMLDFGGRAGSIESAKQALRAANWTHNRNIQNVIIAVLRAYYGYMDAVATVEARTQDLKDSETNLDAAQHLYKAGIKTKVDKLQAEANLYNAKSTLEEAKGIEKTTMGRLANALGLEANIILNLEHLPEELPTIKISEDIDMLLEIAKSERPDLAAAYSNLLQKEADLRVAFSAGMPTLSANVNLNRINYFNASPLNSYVYNSGIELNVPIFNGYYYISQERRAKSQVDLAYAEMRERESNILLEVVTDYYIFTTAEVTVKYSNEYLKYSQEAYNMIHASYKEGINTYVDLLAAQTVVSNARNEHVHARTRWLVSLSDLIYALGVLDSSGNPTIFEK